MWIGATVIALLSIRNAHLGSLGTPSAISGAWAIIIAFGVGVVSDPGATALLVVFSLVLLAIALVTAGDDALHVLGPRTTLLAPFNAIILVLRGMFHELGGTGTQVRSGRATPAIRGVLLATPIVLLLVFILANADPIFGDIRDFITKPFDDVIPARLLFFLALLLVPLGAYNRVSHGFLPTHSHETLPFLTEMFRGTERRVVVGSVTLVVWLFVVSAVVSLFANPAASAGTGVTYAEYARRGFSELAIAATIVIGVVVSSGYLGPRDDKPVMYTALAALAAVGVMLAIAFIRVLRYEDAYGYTLARVHAQAYMGFLALVLGIVAVDISSQQKFGRFFYRVATTGLCVVTVLIYWNTNAWIANRNIDRAATSGRIDTAYLKSASDDAIPTIATRLNEIPEPARQEIHSWLQCEAGRANPRPNSRWFEWNARAAAADAALRPFRESGKCQTARKPPGPDRH
jgi:hypothetical protein